MVMGSELEEIRHSLENHYREDEGLEFTIEKNNCIGFRQKHNPMLRFIFDFWGELCEKVSRTAGKRD